MLPAALDADEKADPERHRQALEKLEKGRFGHSRQVLVWRPGSCHDLQEWLTKYIFPAEAKNVDEAFVRVGTRLGLAEMLRGGTTTYCDMYYFEDAIADETKKAGMRGVLGETVIDFPVPDNKTFEAGLLIPNALLRNGKMTR